MGLPEPKGASCARSVARVQAHFVEPHLGVDLQPDPYRLVAMDLHLPAQLATKGIDVFGQQPQAGSAWMATVADQQVSASGNCRTNIDAGYAARRCPRAGSPGGLRSSTVGLPNCSTNFEATMPTTPACQFGCAKTKALWFEQARIALDHLVGGACGLAGQQPALLVEALELGGIAGRREWRQRVVNSSTDTVASSRRPRAFIRGPSWNPIESAVRAAGSTREYSSTLASRHGVWRGSLARPRCSR